MSKPRVTISKEIVKTDKGVRTQCDKLHEIIASIEKQLKHIHTVIDATCTKDPILWVDVRDMRSQMFDLTQILNNRAIQIIQVLEKF